MFQTVELGQKVDKETYAAEVAKLRLRLLELQNQLKSAKFSVVVVIAGVEGAGKSETVKVLHEWFDPRFIETHGFQRITEEERQYPRSWRFWRKLPPHGKIGIFFGSWYTDPIFARVYGETRESELAAQMDNINGFEQALVRDGTLVLKFWFHLSRKDQKKRMRKLAKDPEQSFRVTELDWQNLKRYDEFRAVSERALELTGTPEAPWTLVEGADKRFRNLTVGRKLERELSDALERHRATAAARSARSTPPTEQENAAGTGPVKTVLSSVDLSMRADPNTYPDELRALQRRFGRLCRELSTQGLSAVFVFEGWDASGKGGLIRRVLEAMDARHYQVVPVAAPTDEEKAHHYLWRFWRDIPRPGRVTVFDRSWYGRVLVERVEGFASVDEWSRAYREINEFERELVEHGIRVEKFWLHVDPDEQLRRFQERQNTPWKQFKITPEDWRNRDNWAAYDLAVHAMVERTGTSYAPWHLVPSNDKYYARLFTLEVICERLEAHLASAK